MHGYVVDQLCAGCTDGPCAHCTKMATKNRKRLKKKVEARSEAETAKKEEQ